MTETPAEPLSTALDELSKQAAVLRTGSQADQQQAAGIDIAVHRVRAAQDSAGAELKALLESILCTCGHTVRHHTNRDVADVVGWPCMYCKSARCTGFALSAPQEEK